MKTTTPTTGNNQSSEKLMRLLEFLAVQDESLRLIDIAKSLDMNSSTTLRFLNTLVNLGYVAQEPVTSKYYLTYKLCALGQQVKNHQQLPKTARPILREVAKELNETVCLAIEDNYQVVYIDVVEAPGQISKTMKRIGNIAPLYCTGIGKLFLENYSVPQIDEMIARTGLPRFTDTTITTRDGLIQAVQEARQNGYAIDNEECEPGTRCIAFPIYDYTNKIIAGFSVTGSSQRLTDDFFQHNMSYMKKLAAQLSNQLGYRNLD